jgi:hypothetical protein
MEIASLRAAAGVTTDVEASGWAIFLGATGVWGEWK